MLIFYLTYAKPYSPPYPRAAFGLVVSPIRVVDDLIPALYIISHLSDD
jgi:hypothetical protein